MALFFIKYLHFPAVSYQSLAADALHVPNLVQISLHFPDELYNRYRVIKCNSPGPIKGDTRRESRPENRPNP